MDFSSRYDFRVGCPVLQVVCGLLFFRLVLTVLLFDVDLVVVLFAGVDFLDPCCCLFSCFSFA